MFLQMLQSGIQRRVGGAFPVLQEFSVLVGQSFLEFVDLLLEQQYILLPSIFLGS